MRISRFLSLPLALAVLSVDAAATTKACGRKCMANIVDKILASMVAGTPNTLPLAERYKATENSHPTALNFMESWRTIVSVCEPSLLAIDVKNGTAYFALDINEGNPDRLNILRGRVAVVNQQITELELFINRARGDHGYSFDSKDLPANYAVVMDVPSNATLPSRKKLMQISSGLFDGANYSTLNLSNTCQFTEIGMIVLDDGGADGDGPYTPLGCHMAWTDGPFDPNARVGLVVDETLGIVVQSGIVPGVVYAYRNQSAFIPDAFPVAQQQQVAWIEENLGDYPLLYNFGASGETLEVLQYYNGALQAVQINVFMNPPNSTSAWLTSA